MGPREDTTLRSFAIIVGAMKCGTTTLFGYLSQHPELAPARNKEPNFFASDGNWGRGLSWYRSLFEYDPSRHRWGLEASTAYTKMPYLPNAAERMARCDLEYRFIYLMRDPVDRVESHWTMGRARRWRTTAVPPDQGVPEKLLTFTRYASQIGEYYDRFNEEQILLVLLEDLRDDPDAVLTRVCEFLGINPAFPFESPSATRASGAMTRHPLWYRRLTAVPAIRSVLQPLIRWIPGKRFLARGVLGLDRVDRVRLGPGQRRRVREALAPEVRELAQTYGVDVSRWNGVRENKEEGSWP